MKNSKWLGFSQFPNSPPPKPMASPRRPPRLATYGVQIRGPQVPVPAAGPGKASHGWRSPGRGLQPGQKPPTRALRSGPRLPSPRGWATPCGRPPHRLQPACPQRKSGSRRHPAGTVAPPLLTAHGGGGGCDPAGDSGLGAVCDRVPRFRPMCPLPTRSSRPRAGSASDHVARVRVPRGPAP